MASGGSYKTLSTFLENKPYSRWVDEIKVWQTVTELEKKKQGPAIGLNLPEIEGTIRNKVFAFSFSTPNSVNNGVVTLIAFIDAIYKKDELSAAYEAYTDFDRYKRVSWVSMENYVMEFKKIQINKVQQLDNHIK